MFKLLFVFISLMSPAQLLGSDSNTDTTDNYTKALLDEITIYAHTPTWRMVTTEPQQLLNTGYLSAADALAHIQSSIMIFSGRRGETTLLQRGFDQRQLRISIDGIPLQMPYDGQLNLSAIPTIMINHIETNTGGINVSNKLQGLGGSINFITIRPEESPPALVRASISHYGSQQYAAIASRNVEHHGFALGAEYKTRNGYPLSRSWQPALNENGGFRENSQSWSLALGGKYIYDYADWNINAALFHQHGAWGLPPHVSSTLAHFDKFSNWQATTNYIAIAYPQLGSWQIKTKIHSAYYENTLQSYDDSSYTTQETANAYNSTYRDFSVGIFQQQRSDFDVTKNISAILHIDGQMRFESHTSNEQIRDETSQSAQALYSLSLSTILQFHKSHLQSQIGLHINGAYPLQIPDEMPTASNMLAISPHASIWYEITSSMFIMLNLAMRDRFPTLKERYATSYGIRLANPELKAEQAYHADLTLTYKASKYIQLQVSPYYSHTKDLINIASVGTGMSQMQNIANANLYGIDSEITSWFWLAKLRIQHTYLYTVDTATNQRLENRPDHRLIIAGECEPTQWLALFSQYIITGKRRFYDADLNLSGTMHSFGILNLGTRFIFRKYITFEAWIHNATDTQYSYSFGYPAAGREFWVTGQYRW